MDNYTLDKSKGSQTAILPKSTYKELQTQPRLVKMTVYLHLHDKYKTFNVLIKIPDEYKDYPLGGKGGQLEEYKWANHLPLPEMIGEWNPKETNIVEYNWDTYYLDEDEYYYAIFGVTIVKNKKYKREKVAPPVEEVEPQKMPRQRRPKQIAEIEPQPEPAPAIPSRNQNYYNRKMEEIQRQMEEIQGQKAEAEKAYITACLHHAEARKAVEETLVLQKEANAKHTELLQKDEKIKAELEKVKKELKKNENKNGYIVLAHDDYGGKEEVYGRAQTFKEAKTLAKEAVEIGKGRIYTNGLKYDDNCIEEGEKVEALWNGDGKWYSATITKVYTTKKYDVEWDDQTTSSYLHEKKIKKLIKHKRFNSARIVDLDTHIEVEEFGKYIDGEASW
jgi:hypothetical protein